VTRFDNPPTQPQVGGEAWKSYPQRAEADNAWRDGLDGPERQFIEALDELHETWGEASKEVDRDFARALSRWPEPARWHLVAGGLLAVTGICSAVAGALALASQNDAVAVTADSVVSILLACLAPLTVGTSALLRRRGSGRGHTGLEWRGLLLGLAIVLPLATVAMMRESWATPALWAFLPLAAVLGTAAVTGWRFSRPSDR